MESLFLIMRPLPPLNDGECSLIVRHSIDSEEEMIEAVVDAFLAAGVDAYDRPTTLAEWIDPDVFETLQWSSSRPLYLGTLILDHEVVITPDQVAIYTAPGGVMRSTARFDRQTGSSESSRVPQRDWMVTDR